MEIIGEIVASVFVLSIVLLLVFWVYIAKQQVSRLDTNTFSESVANELKEVLQDYKVEVVIIADYLYGVVLQEVIDIAISFCKENKVPIFYTSRDLGRIVIDDYPIVVVNQKEWKLWKHSEECPKAFVTKGNEGRKLIRELLADKKEISIRELDEKAKEQGISGRTMCDVRSRMKNELEYRVNEKQENSIRLKE